MQISSGNEFNASDNICNCNKDMRAVKCYHVCVCATCRALPRTLLHAIVFFECNNCFGKGSCGYKREIITKFLTARN